MRSCSLLLRQLTLLRTSALHSCREAMWLTARARVVACESGAASGVVGLGGCEGKARSGVGGVCPGDGGGEGVCCDGGGDNGNGNGCGGMVIASVNFNLMPSMRRRARWHWRGYSRHLEILPVSRSAVGASPARCLTRPADGPSAAASVGVPDIVGCKWRAPLS